MRYTKMKNLCLRCQEPLDQPMHWCAAGVLVFHPIAWSDLTRNSNPLDRLTVEDWIKIEGNDPDDVRLDNQERIARQNEEYLNGPLTFRVELRSVNGLGHRGAVDVWAVHTQGNTDADLTRVMDFINSEPCPMVGLIKGEVYALSLVSLDSVGIRYVWKSKRVEHVGRWTLSDWH